MFEYVISVFNYFAFCLCFPWNWKSSSVIFAAQGFDMWDRDKWRHLDSNFRQLWRFLHLKYKIFCTIFILKCLYDSLLGSDHLIHVEIAMLKDRRMGCKARDAYFSLRCYICILSLALSLFSHFFSLNIPTQTAAVWCSLGIVHWCQTDSHRNHRSRKICRSCFPSPRG